MNGVIQTLPLAAGAGGGLKFGEHVGNIINHAFAVSEQIAPDVQGLCIIVLTPLAALAAHWLMSIDLNKDGAPDLAAPAPQLERARQ